MNHSELPFIIGTSAGAICEIEENSEVAFQLKTMPIQAVSWVDTHTLSESVAQAIGSVVLLLP